MELKLTETRKFDGKVLELYEIARYTVRVCTYESGYKSIDVREERADYLPTIYCITNDDNGDVLGFKIQTTSYGSLPVEEIRKVISGLEEAIQAAEILTAEFVK